MNITKREKKGVLQGGFTLLETVVAIVVASLILVVVIKLFAATAKTTEDNSITQAAELRAEEGLSALTASGNQLGVGGSFDRTGDTDITLSPCGPATCDYIMDPEAPITERNSPAGGVAYGSQVPEGSLAFVRRWRVEDVSTGDYQLRRITIAVQKVEQDTTPVVLEDSVIPIGQ